MATEQTTKSQNNKLAEAVEPEQDLYENSELQITEHLYQPLKIEPNEKSTPKETVCDAIQAKSSTLPKTCDAESLYQDLTHTSLSEIGNQNTPEIGAVKAKRSNSLSNKSGNSKQKVPAKKVISSQTSKSGIANPNSQQAAPATKTKNTQSTNNKTSVRAAAPAKKDSLSTIQSKQKNSSEVCTTKPTTAKSSSKKREVTATKSNTSLQVESRTYNQNRFLPAVPKATRPNGNSSVQVLPQFHFSESKSSKREGRKSSVLRLITYGCWMMTTTLLVAVLTLLVLSILANTSKAISDIQKENEDIKELVLYLSLEQQTAPVPECGEGNWLQIVNLNISDLSQQCPPQWREVSTPTRSCGRPTDARDSCNSVFYSVLGGKYSRVCGRVAGYSFGGTDAFASRSPHQQSIDEIYVDGVSITYGSPRNHIWTLAASNYSCPCDNNDPTQAPLPPPFVGDNYFCDSELYGTLWDAQGCTNTTDCCTVNTPPWFSVKLSNSTNKNIEVRICSDEETSIEDSQVALIQLYVQLTVPTSS